MLKIAALVAAIGFCALLSIQAMAAEKNATIGNARIVVRTVTGTLESDLRQIQLRDDIYHNEIIETGDDSATEFVFLDETKLALGPTSRMVLDLFVFDPASDTGSFIMSATVGVFRFVSGKIPKMSYEIRTPNAVIGIRGTILSFIVIRGDTEDKPAKVNITIEEGVAEITSCSGEQVSLSRPGASITVSMNSDGICTTSTPPVAQATEFTRMLAALDIERQ